MLTLRLLALVPLSLHPGSLLALAALLLIAARQLSVRLRLQGPHVARHLKIGGIHPFIQMGGGGKEGRGGSTCWLQCTACTALPAWLHSGPGPLHAYLLACYQALL